MPTKFDASGKRWVEMEFLVPGTPEQVWQAMATGPGNAAWFTRAEIEEKIGGRLTFHFMPGVTSGGRTTLSAKGNATRAQVAVMLHRFLTF